MDHPNDSWHMVNLWENYDEELLERFSREMVVPNYKKEELQPLNDWKYALSPEGRKNPFIPDLHVLLAFKKDTSASPLSTPSTSSTSSPLSPSPLSPLEHITLSPAGSPTMSPQMDTTSHKLKGGIIFEYYSDINCGLFNYLIIKRKHRNKGLDRELIKKAIDTLDKSAHGHGHLAGINAMFFETKSAQNVTHQQDVLDPRQQHAILHQMGFRLLDFDYVQLPLAKLGKVKYLLLTVYLTPHIPKMPLQAAEKYYLPSVLLKNFIHALWENAYAANRIKNKPEEDPDFRRSIEQIELREKIPLLDLPWGAGKPWTLVDLWEDYDEELLVRFYRELIVPLNKRDDAEFLAKLKTALSPEGRENAFIPDVHILLAVRWPQQHEYRTHMTSKPVIDGACVFEYHPENNCGLLTGLLQQRKNRVDGLDVLLVETTLEILNQNAKERGNLAGCNAIFLQAKSSAYSSTYSQDIIDITQHHIVLHKMGFRLLDFEYVAPRSRTNVNRPFVLTVYLTPLIPIMYYEKGDRAYLPNTLIRNFVERQWLNAHGTGAISHPPERSQDYQRMLEQVELREKIPLLDLPWVGGKPWTLVDLWEDYDEDLLRRFYQELMLPNFPNRHELEPIDNWLRSLSSECRDDPNVSDVHVLLAMKWPTGNDTPSPALNQTPSSPSLAQTPSSSSLSQSPSALSLSQSLSSSSLNQAPGSPSPNPTNLRSSSGGTGSLSSSLGVHNPPIIEGGIVFEYYSGNNCGLLTYLIVHRNYRGQGLDRVLVESALEILDHNAKDKGYLPGCNAIFLEVSSAEKVTMKQDVVDPRMRHTIYHQIGFRLIDCEYIAPPLSPEFPKLKDLFLTVYLTPHIPKMPLEENKYYLPSSVLKNFITVLWHNATASGKIKGSPNDDPDFIRSIEQIELREKIPLLDLPWGATKPWTLVDLWEDYDEELLHRFYNELMIPNFPLRDELEPLENFLEGLSDVRRTTYTQQPELHIIMALRWPDGAAGITLGGGITFEYYPSTNCGLLTYLIVHRSSRGQGLASVLVERAVHLLQQTARRRGHLAGCNAILLETNSAEKVTVQQDVMDPRMRHTIYHKMGFRLLDFEYIMPPLGKGFEKLKGVLLLTVYLTPHIPWLPLTHGGKYYYLPSVLLKNFISGQWQHAHLAGRTPTPAQNDPDFRMSIDQIELREKIPLLDLPWGDGKDWTVVDLWEDYDEDLLDAFYRKYMTAQFGASDEIEPLENWHKALSTEGRDDPNICDLHVLLSLLLSGEHKGHKGHKYIVGGLVFEYYPITNCALVTYVVVNEQYSNKGIGTDLLRRAITILDQNAKTKGHISGCNAIFLEVKFVQNTNESLNHQFLFNKGFRLLDFEYYQPPTSLRNPISHNVCLTLLLTPRIPRYGESDDAQPFIPSALLRSFITTLWADECGLIFYPYEKDNNYIRMLEQLDEHDHFKVLDLPWSRDRVKKTPAPTPPV